MNDGKWKMENGTKEDIIQGRPQPETGRSSPWRPGSSSRLGTVFVPPFHIITHLFYNFASLLNSLHDVGYSQDPLHHLASPRRSSSARLRWLPGLLEDVLLPPSLIQIRSHRFLLVGPVPWNVLCGEDHQRRQGQVCVSPS